jgi:pSer/pThr/pTyr-binding forkhead associated (FHA) protein
MPEDAILTIQGRAEAVRLTGNGPWRLGRDDSSEIHFPDDPGCSRTQARIRRDGGEGFILENLSASSTTRCEGHAVTSPMVLHDGATIGFSR